MRLIDLHCDWLLQYANETTVFDGSVYGRVQSRLGQTEGYLQGTSAAILSCYRHADDWARYAHPWTGLAELVARIDAEFSGRLLVDAADATRWLDDPDGLCWGLLGVEGFDPLVREPKDLERLRGLFERGVRLFQPLYTANNALGGSSVLGDDRGLTNLGRDFLQALVELGTERDGPRPILDLAHMNPRTASETLAWFEADTERSRRMIPVYSHGALAHEGFATPRAITHEHLRRLRALGGVVGFSVGPPFYESAEALQAGIEQAAELPFQGRAGVEGIAMGTDFLGIDRTVPGLGHVDGVVRWAVAAFSAEFAAALVRENARTLLLRAVGHTPTA